jgi:hypothetical protein
MPSWVSATVKAVSSLALLLMSRIWSTSNKPDIGPILKTLGFGISNKRSSGTVHFELWQILLSKNEIIRITLKSKNKLKQENFVLHRADYRCLKLRKF